MVSKLMFILCLFTSIINYAHNTYIFNLQGTPRFGDSFQEKLRCQLEDKRVVSLLGKTGLDAATELDAAFR